MSALEDFVTETSTNYLQSVVFVDDNIYESKDGKPLEDSTVPSGLGAALESQFEDSVEAAEPSAEQSPLANTQENAPAALAAGSAPAHYHPRELMESFAQKGIVCALYEPRPGFKSDPSSVLFHLCEKADVIILDWDLYNDDGDAASALLSELIKKSQAEHPHHIRLCTIYTNRPSLHPVVDSLLAKLKAKGCTVDVDGGKLRLIAGATWISIFGKPFNDRPPRDAPYEVKESDLAARVISEFSSLHHGLLPALALHGLASVRHNTKRLLEKFHSELDGSFLLHRALVLSDGDAFHDLPELLSEEIRAIIEDKWPADSKLKPVILDAASSVNISDPVPGWKSLQGVDFDIKPAFRDTLIKGIEGLAEAQKKCNELKNWDPKDGFKGMSPSRLKDFEKMLSVQGLCWSETLAALFCNRTQYGSNERKLQFGAVIRHRVNESLPWKYSLCLMPICDSQRLKKVCAFPFWELKEDAKAGSTGKRFGVVVKDAEGNTHCLAAGGKIREKLWTHSFSPGTDGWVLAVHAGGKFTFSTEGMIIEWVAELKPLHAQRIAAYLGAEVSRVGLVESEWLRLFCDR